MTFAYTVQSEAESDKHLECRYQFESREAFARYERDHAPKLRADALKKFPPSSGLTMSRTSGAIVFVLSGS